MVSENMKINKEMRWILVDVISRGFENLCYQNDLLISDHIRTIFHCITAPSISIKLYLQKIVKFTRCSEESLVLSLIYIDRLNARNTRLRVSSKNFHKLFLTSIVCAMKFYDDQYFSNKYYGQVGGVPTKELNLMEERFLFDIQFDLSVSSTIYNKYHKYIMRAAQQYIPEEPKSAIPVKRAYPILAFGSHLYQNVSPQVQESPRKNLVALPEMYKCEKVRENSNMLNRHKRFFKTRCFGASLTIGKGTCSSMGLRKQIRV